MAFYVYLLASRQYGTFYTGVTNDLVRRVHEHREKTGSVFTRRYRVDRLVYYETYDTPEEAIRREKRLKRWPRAWKVRTIEAFNPDWKDLYDELNR
jgi:putative endonuclease